MNMELSKANAPVAVFVALIASTTLGQDPIERTAKGREKAATVAHFHPTGKPPSTHTIAKLKAARATLPFADTRDFEEQKKGFIAAPKAVKGGLVVVERTSARSDRPVRQAPPSRGTGTPDAERGSATKERSAAAADSRKQGE